MAELVTVATTAGQLRGVDACGTRRFFGVPYGESTAGAGRFALPRAKEPWAGVRDTFVFGPSAPQVDFRLGRPSGRGDRMIGSLNPRGGSPTEAGELSEDCLAVNIWAPSGSTPDSPVPVMVWLHGGAYLTGSANETAFHADVLSERENVVVVTVIHRLGLLGFTPWENLDASFAGAGVAGMVDIVLALEWVRDNIRAFGGDPGNVTVFGQSGGGAKTATLLTMPRARGLFHKAILQSPSSPDLPLKEDHELLSRYAAEELGVTADSLERLRDLPVEEILRAQQVVEARVDPGRVLSSRARPQLRIGPYVDGDHIAFPFYSDAVRDVIEGMPLIVGSAAHEYSMKLLGLDEYPDATDEIVAEWLVAELGDNATATVAEYARRHDELPRLRWSRITADMSFRGVAFRAADHVSAQGATAYQYVFNQPTDIIDGMLGSNHSLDLAFTFGTVDRIPMAGRGPGRFETSEHMMDAWGRFAHTGDPNGGTLRSWPAWNPQAPELLLIQPHPQVVAADEYAPVATESGSRVIVR